MKETLVVIPYLAEQAQGHELSLAICGWMRHFKEPYKIVIVGDAPRFSEPFIEINRADIETFNPLDHEFSEYEGWYTDKKDGEIYACMVDNIFFIPCPRVEPIEGQYRPHIDHVHKFRKVREFFPDTEGFIYTCDDIYAVADFTLEDVEKLKYPEIATKYLDERDWDKKKADWWSDRGKTAELCRKEGLPVRDWVCHLPVYYEWDRLLSIYDKYDCDHNSYIVENIYFGIIYNEGEPIVDARDYRDEVLRSNPDIRPLGSVKWIYNANCGWSEKLESILEKHYLE